MAHSTEALLQAALGLQQRALTTQPPPDWTTRASRLKRLDAALREQRDAIRAAISADFGNRSPHETDLAEIFPSLAAIRHGLNHGRRWMRRRRMPTDIRFRPGRCELIPQPKGVIGIVVPWNYPLQLAVRPLAAALCAGNRVMLKMSEHTPRFSRLFEQIIAHAFAPEEVSVVNGGVEVGQCFVRLPFDHLLFTGATALGVQVMQAASANLTPVTLELGGKSPTIIDASADFDAAVERILVGKLLNAGQTCIAPDYVLLPRGSKARFIEAARRSVAKLYPQLGDTRDYTTIINARQYARLQRLLDEARDAGAQLTPLTDIAADPARRLLPPVIVSNAPDDTALMREEIFGPLLPLVPVDSLDAALAYVNARPRPLALYVFARDRAAIECTLAGTAAGGVTVNDTLLHIAQEALPFGGLGASGMGAYHGEAGFNTFSHLKPVFHQSRLNGMFLFKPPYGARFEKLVNLLLR